MPVPDPKQNQTQAGGGAQKSTYPLERYTVAPNPDEGNGVGDKSPYYKSSAPSISLPKGGGALKGIDEKFTVNAVNGTAALQVPFPLSQGRGGFTPNLSLQYNSGSGNSEFGLGWSLSLPAIQRKTDKQLPRYDDANESDVFIMAGAEDLLPKFDFNTSVSEWEADILPDEVESSLHYTIKRYRPRIEGLWARIEFISKHGTTDSWWKVTTKENVVTFYGFTAGARLCDPEDDARIFKWLPEVSYDNKGNVQLYSYVTENTAADIPVALHERNHTNGLAPFTNVYLKSVKYCNRTHYVPSSGHFYDISSVLPDEDEFLMEAVLDYGDHDLDFPEPEPSSSIDIPARVDPFSDFHAGFEIRTYRRCMRVLMFHYFDELADGDPVLVRSLDLTYQHGTTPTGFAEADFITEITQSGYLLSGSDYIKMSLPAVTIDYVPFSWDKTVHNVSPKDAENAPQGLTDNYQWIDLWGEGLPGILSEQANGWVYKSNNGDGQFTPALSIAPKPSFQGLGSSLQWQDLDADGRRQLVSRSGGLQGYFELDDNQKWQNFRVFNNNVNIDWNSPFTKMLDLNGDGKPDVLLTQDCAWKWYENEGTDGYTEGGYGSVALDEEKGPRLLLNDTIQSVFLADMNGDGLTDIVRIRNGEVCYWPNKGYGNFGPMVTMTNAPLFDTADLFNPQYITLADISGTGAPDIIYIGGNKCTAWINYSGNAWSEGTEIIIPGMEQYSKITVADFLGSGTSCIVWSSPLPQHAWAPMRYIDLMGGNKPHLMATYHNGMGKTVELTYKHSTKYYLEDRAAGTPWATRLPFPVHCISHITTSDEVSQTSYTQQYSYHHGYYDHEEREFRGFGRVDTVDTDSATAFDPDATTPPPNDLDQAPVLTRTWYHTGAWLRQGTLLEAYHEEYCPTGWEELPDAPMLPSGLSPQEQREAYRALKGQPVRQEVYALDGSSLEDVPYTVTTNAYCIELVQPVGDNRCASFYSYRKEGITWDCERDVEDPRILHEMTIEVDEYGNVLEAAKIAYPRVGSMESFSTSDIYARQTLLLATYTVTGYTADVTTGGYRLRMPSDVQIYELGISYSSGSTIPGGGLLTAAGVATVFGAADVVDYTAVVADDEKRLVGHTRTMYLDDDGATVLAYGSISLLGLPHCSYQLAFTDAILSDAAWYDGRVTGTMLEEGGYVLEDDITDFGLSSTTDYWLPGGTVTYDAAHFYTPVAYTDPWGNDTDITYWDAGGTSYYLLPEAVTDAVSNVTTVLDYNWYNLQPTHIKDPNNNESKILYDALGMPVAAAVMSKDGSGANPGDTLSGIDPHDSTDIDNQEDFFTTPASVAADLLQGATWRCVYDLTASPVAVGMIGRELHNTVDPDCNLLIRLSYTDGMGRVAMHKVQAAPEEGDTAIRWIGSGKTVYNNKGKAVMQYEPYFSDAAHTYDDAEQAAMAGVSPRMHYDPMGRVRRTDMPDGSYTKNEWSAWWHKTYDANDTCADSDWFTAYSAGTTEEQDAADKAEHHDGTPTITMLDALARPFATRQHNRIEDSTTPWDDIYYHTWAQLDIQGNRTELTDPRGGSCVNTYAWGMLKAMVVQTTIDAGTQYMLTDAAGQPLYAWDADDRLFNFTYDALRRPLKKLVTISSTVKTLEMKVYGEGATSAADHNLKGQLYESYDGLGYKKIPDYDFKGNPLQVDQQFLADKTTADVDWEPTAPSLDSETFTSSTTYDALGRPLTITDPGGNITRNVYDIGGALCEVYLTPSGGSESAYVEYIYYNALGQRMAIGYGNDTRTGYTYDPLNYRLTRLLTTKSSNTYQDLNYWYDAVGNITFVRDASQRSLYFDNHVTNPEQEYTYDALYRLIKATGREQIGTATFGSTDNFDDSSWAHTHKGDDTTTQNYTQKYEYDQPGNILQLQHIAGSGSYTRSYTYTTGTNRLASTNVGSTTYSNTHDNRGNIIVMPHLSSIGYNANNELATANLGGGGNLYCQYSGGMRGRKTKVNGSTTEVRMYFGNFEIYRKFVSSSLTLERTTVHINDDTGRVAMYDKRTSGTDSFASSTVRYVYSNHLSTASLELDGSAAIISYEEYHPYGTSSYKAMNASVNAVAKLYKYTGKERDEETGLYYIGARYYCPWLARWCAADPINSEWYNLLKGVPQRNRERDVSEIMASGYEYCYDNPVKFIDPSGEQARINYTNESTAPVKTTGSNPTPAPVDPSMRAPQTPNAAWEFMKMRSPLATGIVEGAGNFVASTLEGISYVANHPVEAVKNTGKLMYATSPYGMFTPTGMEVNMQIAQKLEATKDKFVKGDAHTKTAMGTELVLNIASFWFGAGEAKTASTVVKTSESLMVGSGGNYVSKMSIVRQIEHGEKISDIASSAQLRTLSTGVEHAVVRLGPNSLSPGARVLVSGGPHGITFNPGEITTLFGHTHPFATGASKADFQALRILNQSKQYIYEGLNPVPLTIRKP